MLIFQWAYVILLAAGLLGGTLYFRYTPQGFQSKLFPTFMYSAAVGIAVMTLFSGAWGWFVLSLGGLLVSSHVAVRRLSRSSQ